MPKLIDETGNKYGDLVVIKRAENHISPNGKSKVQWLCKCSCGNEIVTLGDSLRGGRTKSCGKCGRNIRNREEVSDNLTREMIGKTYGFLKVLKLGSYENTSENKRRRKVICECLLCGDTVEVRTNYLKSGDTTSCGKHNKSRGEIYVRNFLKLNNYSFYEEYIFSELIDKNPLRFDFSILNKENKVIGCIEIQGNQHYDNKNGWYNLDIIKHDKMKEEYCRKENIPLLILDYSKGQNKTDFQLWDKTLKNFLEELFK